jgi:hypothetical protein
MVKSIIYEEQIIICYSCKKLCKYIHFDCIVSTNFGKEDVCGSISGGCNCEGIHSKICTTPRRPHDHGNLYPNIPKCLTNIQLERLENYFSET